MTANPTIVSKQNVVIFKQETLTSNDIYIRRSIKFEFNRIINASKLFSHIPEIKTEAHLVLVLPRLHQISEAIESLITYIPESQNKFLKAHLIILKSAIKFLVGAVHLINKPEDDIPTILKSANFVYVKYAEMLDELIEVLEKHHVKDYPKGNKTILSIEKSYRSIVKHAIKKYKLGNTYKSEKDFRIVLNITAKASHSKSQLALSFSPFKAKQSFTKKLYTELDQFIGNIELFNKAKVTYITIGYTIIYKSDNDKKDNAVQYTQDKDNNELNLKTEVGKEEIETLMKEFRVFYY